MSDDGLFLGDQLKKWRKARGLTLEDLAADLETSKGYLSQMERNVRPLNSNWLARIASVYKIQVQEIIGAQAEPTNLDEEWAAWERDLKEAGKFETAKAIVRALVSGGTPDAPRPAESEKASSKARKAE